MGQPEGALAVRQLSWRLIGGLAGCVLLLVVIGWIAFGGSSTSAGEDAGIPEADLAGSGAPLADGFTVVDGAVLIGQVVVTDLDSTGTGPGRWEAVLVVGDTPLDVWQAYLVQAASFLSNHGIKSDTTQGCERTPLDGFSCSISADGHPDSADRRAIVGMTLDSVPGDVTGSYLLHLSVTLDAVGVYGPSQADVDIGVASTGEWSEDGVPDPEPARARPGIGDPISPETTRHGQNSPLVLLDGSELLALYGSGDGLDGMDALLSVSPGTDLRTLASAYAQQVIGSGVQAPTDLVSYAGTTVTRYTLGNGVDGYAGRILAVDGPDGDYLFYSVAAG